MRHLNLLKSDGVLLSFSTITFIGLHFFYYLAAIFEHIEKEKYVELRIT